MATVGGGFIIICSVQQTGQLLRNCNPYFVKTGQLLRNCNPYFVYDILTLHTNCKG